MPPIRFNAIVVRDDIFALSRLRSIDGVIVVTGCIQIIPSDIIDLSPTLTARLASIFFNLNSLFSRAAALDTNYKHDFLALLIRTIIWVSRKLEIGQSSQADRILGFTPHKLLSHQ